MNGMANMAIRIRSLVLYGVLLCSFAVASGEGWGESELSDAISNAFSYPNSKLIIKRLDLGPRLTKKGVFFGAEVDSSDGSFVPINIGVGKRGSLLDKSLEVEFEKATKIGSSHESGAETSLRKIMLTNYAYAYSGYGAAGPEGAYSMVFVVFPKAEVEVLFGVNAPAGERFRDLKINSQDYINIYTGGISVEAMAVKLGILAQVVAKIATRIAGTELRFEETIESISEEMRYDEMVGPAERGKHAADSDDPGRAIDSKREYRFWLPVSIALLLVLFALVRYRNSSS